MGVCGSQLVWGEALSKRTDVAFHATSGRGQWKVVEPSEAVVCGAVIASAAVDVLRSSHEALPPMVSAAADLACYPEQTFIGASHSIVESARIFFGHIAWRANIFDCLEVWGECSLNFGPRKSSSLIAMTASR